MGIYVKGMEMPKSCFCGCPISGAACILWKLMGAEGTEMRHKDCPLVEVSNHGDLIDAHSLKIRLGKRFSLDKRRVMEIVREIVGTAKVVIPADKE